MELVALIAVIGFALFWQRSQNTTSAAAILHAVSAMLVLLFLSSLVGLLLPCALILLILGSALALLEGRHCAKRKSFPVPIGIFAVLGVIFWLLQSNSLYYFYDEYSHWGVFVKEMISRNALWGADTNSMHPRYLPGTPLWQYFFAMYSRVPEGAAYLAQFTLLLTPLLVLWERLDWRQIHWHIGILVLFVVAVSNFGHGITSLYVDHLLGAWFAGVLLNFVLEFKNRSMWQLTSYLLPLAVIILIKTTGAFFAFACAGIITLLLFFVHDSAVASRWTRAHLQRVIVFPAATLIVCIFILAAWNSNRNAISLPDTGGSTGTVAAKLLDQESIFDEAQQTELKRRFVEVVLHQQIGKDELSARYNAFSYPLMTMYTDAFRLTTASLLGLSLIALMLVWHFYLALEFRRSWAIMTGCTWLTAIAYIGVLYFGYRYVSGNQNGFELSSYIRYAHSMLLPVFLFSFAGLVPAFADRQKPRTNVLSGLTISGHSMVFGLALVAMIVSERPYLKPAYTERRPPEFRLQLEPLTEQVRAAIGEASLWVFFPNNVTNGLVGQMLQYQLSPGATFVEEDASVLLGDQAAVREDLRHWEYAWFVPQHPELDAALERLLGHSITARVFRINTSGDAIAFEPVPNVFKVVESKRQNE
jgi:hypothetical protein